MLVNSHLRYNQCEETSEGCTGCLCIISATCGSIIISKWKGFYKSISLFNFEKDEGGDFLSALGKKQCQFGFLVSILRAHTSARSFLLSFTRPPASVSTLLTRAQTQIPEPVCVSAKQILKTCEKEAWRAMKPNSPYLYCPSVHLCHNSTVVPFIKSLSP